MTTKEDQNSEPVRNGHENKSEKPEEKDLKHEQNNHEDKDESANEDSAPAENSGKSVEDNKETIKDQPIQENHSDQTDPESPENEQKDATNEKSAEKDSEAQESEETKEVNYTDLSREELVSELVRLMSEESYQSFEPKVDAIKSVFYKKNKQENDSRRKKFLKEGGKTEDFAPHEDPLEKKMKELLDKFKDLKVKYHKEQEEKKELNLELKYQIIEELKELVNKKESIGETFKEFRELQKRWKEIGPIPQKKVRDTWSTYHHHVEKFYDYIKINKELRDLDLKKNLEAKITLCEKVEKLVDDSSVVNAFKTLQKYHNQWREIGPVPIEERDNIWERFKAATKIINKKHQDFFKSLKEQQKANLEAKSKLCDRVESISENNYESHNDWTHKTHEILEIQAEWRTIGFAPKKDNNKIYARFRKACDEFFDKKRKFYAHNKELQDQNLELKEELCEKAEALKDSEDWKRTTRELINLQKKWKEIGPIPRKHSEKIWKRFRAACDHFFDRKGEHFKDIEKVYEKNLQLKQELIEKVRAFEFGDNPEDNFKNLKAIQDEWSQIGFVPYEVKDKVQNEFRQLINEKFDILKIDETEKSLYKYKTKIDNILVKPKANLKLRHEREKCFNKIKKLESKISLWENNLGFISSDSEQADNMIADFEKKIAEAKSEMETLEEKVRMIDRMDNDSE